MNPVDLEDNKRFERVSFGANTLPHPDDARRSAQGGERPTTRVETPEAFLSQATNAPFTPSPSAQQNQTPVIRTERDVLKQGAQRVTRSPLMTRLLTAYNLTQIQHEDLNVSDDVSIVIRALGKEDFSWAQNRTHGFNLENLVANEAVYMTAVAAACVAAIRVRNPEGLWETEPIPVALGLITKEQMALFRDPLFPPYNVRRLCAEDLFIMFMGISDHREENLLATLGETIAVGWEEKIGQKLEDLAGPLSRLQSALKKIPTKNPPTGETSKTTQSNSGDASPQNSEQR